MNAFYLCHDPIGIMPEGMIAFVFTPDKPRFFATLIQLDTQKSVQDMDYAGCNVLFRYYTVSKEMQFYMLLLTSGGNIDKAQHAKLNGALHEAANWYCTCLAHKEKKELGANGGWDVLKPYNDVLTDVQLLQFKATNDFLLSYHDGIIRVGSLEEAQDYMKEVLGYPASVLKEGMLNQG